MTTTHPQITAILDRLDSVLYKARFAVLGGLRRQAERDLERAAAGAFRAVAARINDRRLTTALRAGDIEAALAEIPFDEVLAARLRADVGGAIRDTVAAAGNRAAQLVRQRLTRKDVSYAVRVDNFRFDVLNEAVLTAMQQHGAELVTEMTTSSKLALRELLAAMLEEGVPVTSQVNRIKTVVGLRSDQVRAVENFRAKLEALGKSRPYIERRVAAYARQSHRYRAQTIARYESGWATNAGQQQAYQQARDEGLITNQAQRVWRTAGDDVVRDEHAAMEGEKVGLEDSFTLPDGSQIMFPPTDPGCRCAVDLEP